MEVGNNSKRLQELYDGLIKDNYDLNSIGRNIDEFAEKLATDTVFSNFVYDDLRSKTGFSGSKADFLVKALGSRVVPSSISKGRKTVPPYKPNKNEYVHFETPIKNVLGGGEKTAEDYAIDALEATGRATPITPQDRYSFQKRNVVDNINAQTIVDTAQRKNIANKQRADLSITGRYLLPEDVKERAERKQDEAKATAIEYQKAEKAQRQQIDDTLRSLKEKAQRDYNDYAAQLREQEEKIPAFIRADKDAYVSTTAADLAMSVPAATLKLVDDTEKLLNAPKKGGNWASSMWAGAKDAADAESFFSFGLSGLAKSATIKGVTDRYLEGKNLTDKENDLMEALATNTLVAYMRKDDVSGWYTAGQIAEMSAEISTQFLGTNFIGSAATKAVAGGIGKFISKNAPKIVAKLAAKGLGGTALRGTRFVGKGAIDTFVGGTAQSLFMPNTYDSAIQTKTGTVAFGEGKGQYDVTPSEYNLAQSLVSGAIESVSERAGGAFAGFGGKVAKNIIPTSWGKLSSKGIVGDIIKAGGTANRYLSKAGINGQFGELAEEGFGQVLNRINGTATKEEWANFWSKDNMLQMIGGFAPMSLVGLGANTVSVAKSSLDAYRADRALLNFARQNNIAAPKKMLDEIKNVEIENLHKVIEEYVQELGGVSDNKLNDIGVEFNKLAANVVAHNIRKDIYAAADSEVSPAESVTPNEYQEVTEENVQEEKQLDYTIPQLRQGDEVEYDNAQWIVGDVADEDGDYQVGEESIPLRRGNVLLLGADGESVQVIDSAADLYPEQQNVDNEIESKRQAIYEQYRPVMNVDTGNITQLSSTADNDNIAYVIKGRIVYDEDGNIDYDRSDDTIYYKVYDKEGNEVDGGTPKPIYLKTRRTEFGKVLSDVPIEEYVDNELYPQEQDNIQQAINNGPTNIEQSTPAESVTPNEYQDITEKNDSTEFDGNGLPFVKTSNGVTDFGYIPEDTGLTPAPIRLSIGDERTGAQHIADRHGEQIAKAGFDNVVDFVEYVASNYDTITEGVDTSGEPNGTYLLQAKDKHNNTLYVELSNDGSYWNVNSGGVFRKGYGEKNKVVWSASEVQRRLKSATPDTLRSQDEADNQGDPNRTVSDTTSTDKGTTNNLNEQEEFYNSLPRNKKGEIDESQMSAEQKIGYAQAEFGQRTDLVRDYVAEQSKALSEKIAKLTNKTGKSVAEYKELAAMQEDKNVFVEYLNEQRQQQEQATPRRTVEEAAAEREERRAAEKEQREQAIREKEERDGVPDFMQDTPEDARLRGFRLRTGERIDRQEPIETGKYNTARRKFTNDTGAVEGGRPEADIAEVGESRDVLYMTTDEINDRFNEELQQQIDGTLPKGHVYSLGIPNDILRSAGLPNLPIEMSAEMLKNKSSAKYRQHHPFDISSIKDLPRAIQNPIAVFNNPNNDGKVLLTELQYNGVNHIVAIKVRSERKSNNIEIDVNSVSTIFPKDRIEKIVEWLLDKENQGRKAYLNKEKVLTWLSDNETITRSKGYNTKDIAKVIKDFENPTLSEEKNEETRLKVSKRKARGATTEKLEELVTLLKKTGFADVKTGEDFYNALAEIEDKEGSRFMIGKQARAKYEDIIRKKNPNITQEDLKTSLDFLHSLEDNKENAKAIKVAVKWLADDTIRLPYAIDNVRKAIAVAEKNKVDPTQYSSPMDIIDEFYKDVEYGSHIDPDRVEAFKNKRVVGKGKNKVAIYDIDDNRQGQEAVCKICHEHFGYSVENKDSKQPWCLASFTRKGKPTESAIKYWDKTYNSVGKKIAFKDGKPIAFMAHDRGHDYDLWWNLRDEPSDNLPLPNGRYISPEGEIELRKYGEGEDELFDEAVEYVADELSDSDVERILGDLKEKIDDGVEDVGISYLFDDAEERAYEKARRSFIETTRYDIDSGDYDKYLKEYIDRYKEKYHIGEDEEIDEDDLDDLKDELAEDIADNFEDYDGAESIWNDIFQEKYEDELYNEDYSLSQKIDMIEDHIRQYPMGSVADDVSDKEIELRGDDLEVDELGGSYRYSRPNGTVLGFVKGNTIYLNPDEVSLNTPIHEFGHLWVSQVKEHFPDLWAKGKELFLESDYLRKVQADPNYRHLDLDGQIDEAMARAIGDRGEQELDKTLLEKILDWIAEVWDKIGGVFGIDNLTSEQISNLTLQDFTDMATSELLSGQNLTERVNGNRGGATRYNTADETADIKARAIADGTFMKAPNGKDTNLTERQWLQVRTKAFKKWFGDWEKTARIEKLKKTKPIEITGEEYKGKYELNRDSAKAYIKDSLRGEYTNKDTGDTILLAKDGAQKVTSHSMGNEAHLKSIAVIPELIEKSIFIDELPNEKNNGKYDSYRYYVSGLKIGGVDYTVKLAIGIDEYGNKYYDHSLTEIEKGKLIDEVGALSTTLPSSNQSALSEYKDSKLISLLQTNSSKVVDENGEPMVVYHGTDTRASFNKFKGAVHFFTENKDIAGDFGVDASMDKVRKGRDFSEYADEKGYLGYKIYETFLSLQNPFIVDADNSEWDEIKTPKEMGGKGAKTTDQIGRWAKRNGYGGVVIKNTIDVNSHIPISQYIAFNPTQIKSATDNIGTFNEEDEDIRYSVEGADERFDKDLDIFKSGKMLSSHKFNLGRPSPILTAAGLNAINIQMTQSVLSKHLDKHNLKTDDLKGLVEAIRTPIMVYEWGDKARNSVIVTFIPRGEERITTTIRLTRDGNKLNVNEISSIYGKSAERLIRDINTPKSEFGKDNLRYVDKKQVLDWFAMEAPKASSQTQQELITATKVIENFENPPINEKKVIDDTTNDMVRYSIRANDQLDREDEIMGKKAAEIYEARVKLRKQMNQSDPKKMPNKEIFDDLSRKTEAKRMKFVETVADQYRAVKSFVDTLNEHGYNISDYNNWYMNVFALAGKNEAEFEKYQAERSKPLQQAAKAAMDSGQISYRELENYLILKHGQERNEYFSERDKGLGIEPLKDYSGVEAVMFEEFCKRTGIEVKTQKESVPQLAEANNNIDILYTDGVSEFSENGRKLPIFEVERRFAEWKKVNDLQSIIANYEQKIGKDKIDDLWAKINYATQFVLDMQKAGGLTSEKMYEKASGMWKYFVPLRGFDVGTAKDEFDYDLNGVVLFTDFKVEPTLGRTRRSTSPLVWTEQMAHITIDQKNRNLLNQSLRRLASISMARRDNILLLSKLYKDVDTKDEDGRTVKGEVKYPPKYTGDTEHDAKVYVDWTAEMKAGVENGTIEEVRQDNVNFGKIVPPAAVKQHIVRVYEGGVPTDVIFNTPPAVPRAINGLNHRTSIGNAWLLRQAKAGTRLMAQSMTTLNPAFVGKNFTRDYLFANAMLVGRENADYVKNFNANVVKAAPILMSYVRGNSLLGWAGKNIKNDKYGGWLTEFVMNGGKTGFSQMLKFEKMSKDFRRQTERGDKTIHYGLNDYMNFIEAINDFAENITRFSAYCASRQAGRSIERSISDAKELTINFNRHGTMGGIWGEFKALSAFANASIQALLVFYRGIKANPKRVSAIISGYVAMPIAMSIMARLVGGDDSDYFKLSKYDRQNNLCLPLFGGGFVKIPLPQELRVFYKLGDEIALSVWNNEPIDMATQEVLMGALDLLPSFASGATSIGDVTGGKMSTGEFIGAHNPITVLQPATQIISNRNFLNYRIYDDNKWGGRKAQLPEYRKALRNKGGETYSPNFVVKLSEGISRLTGGSDLKRGVVEVNPDVINHLMRGYFGGLYSSAVAAINMGDKGAQSIAAGEIKMKTTDSPTMKAFYVSPSNLRYTDDILNAQYMDVLKEAKKRANVYANYLKEGEVDRFEKETKMTEDEALDWRYLVKGIDKEVQELRNEIATAETTKERDEALRQLEALQREAIEKAEFLKK